ncbi:MAG: helix-turn-helix domain-containing protein [bacterium]
MNIINCIIINNDPGSIEKLEQHIEVIKYLRLKKCFSDTAGAMKYLENDNYKSIIFVNCAMKGINFCSFFTKLKPIHLAILTSAKKEDEIIAHKNGAAGFLREPVSFSIFLHTLTKAGEKLSFIEGFYQNSVSQAGNILSNTDKKKYNNSPLTEEQKDRLFNELIQFIETENYYINTNVTINELASKINSNRSYVSQVINEKRSTGFSALINEYRVAEAIRLIMDPVYDGLSIEGISRSVGFVSKSAFYSAFRKVTGQTPQEYKKSKRL